MSKVELNLFPEENTTIVCNLPDGNKFEIDAFELDAMLARVYNGKDALTTLEVTKGMRELFKEMYGFNISLRSMDLLIETKHRLLADIKKNTYLQCDPASSTESSPEPTEN